jgi:glycosidase
MKPIVLFPRVAAAIVAVSGSISGLSAQPTAATTAPLAPWIRDAVVYELNTRTFTREGTFAAVIPRLDSLKALGVSVVWFMPIHPIASAKKKGSIGSPYAIRDYYETNPAFGSKADFKRVVDAAHARGLKVIIDVVANHTGWDNVMMRTPAFYRRDAQGHIVSPYDWTDVAALNYANPELRRYMTDMLVYWLREFNLDGFRCDVAFEVPTDFWESARTALEKVKPDILLLAEAHKPELLVKAFDLDYSWPLHAALSEVLGAGASATKLEAAWREEVATYPKGAQHLRFSDNHDESRAIARFGARGALAASAFMFTLDGVPLLYNGMEVGDVTESGAPALFEKLDVFWDAKDRRPEFPGFYKRLIAFRAEHAALRTGTLTWVRNANPDRVVTYMRESADETLLVAVNFGNAPFLGLVDVAGAWRDITPRAPGAPAVSAALPSVSLDGWEWRVYRRER